MNSVQVFTNEDFGSVRALTIDSAPWFVAKDVCDALGLSNVGQAIVGLDEDEKDSITIDDGTPGNPNKAIITEAGLYSLILRSRKPEAKRFKAERQRADALMEDNARLLPKATMYDVAIEAEGTMTVTQAARYLAQHDKSVNVKRLYALLRADGLICKQDNAPTKKAIERGYMVQMLTTRSDGKANPPYARMTRKGLDWCLNHYCGQHIVA